MRIPRFYQPDSFIVGEFIDLDPINFRHAIQVMRLGIGDCLILFNGKEGEYDAELVAVDRRNARVKIKRFHPINRESFLDVRLVFALIKPDKMDFAIQKAVELGVTSLQPVMTDRAVVRMKAAQMEKKVGRWQSVVHSACEQSGRTAIPLITIPMAFSDYLQQASDRQRILMSPRATADFFSLNQKKAEFYDLIIGPEGGFSDHEEQLLGTSNIHQVQFGSRILRAETAVVAGLTALQLIIGDCYQGAES